MSNHTARSARTVQLLSLMLLIATLLSSLPQPARAALARTDAVGATGPGGAVVPATSGTLRYPEAIDADADPTTNPDAALPVPIVRVGGAQEPGAVRYGAIGLAIEVAPSGAWQNPAGTPVDFRLWNPANNFEVRREVRADAWGAAAAEVLIDDLHLGGRFFYQASAPGFGSTPRREFTIDPTSFAAETRLGAARVDVSVDPDGRLVAEVQSDLPIPEQLGAVQLLVAQLVPTEDGAEPRRELLPPLVAERLDEHHARATIYVDQGDYQLSAFVVDGKVEAHSMPAVTRVPRTSPPAVVAVESIADRQQDGTALVRYRTPSGDLALLRRATDGLPALKAREEHGWTESVRVNAWEWRTDTYAIATEILVDDGKKQVSVEGFAYDPLARRYDIRIDSLMDAPVQDRLTVEVFGPNGVVIYEEETPILLDPGVPLQHSVTVPSDRGEPSGMRIIVHDPTILESMIQKISSSIGSIFSRMASTSASASGFTIVSSVTVAGVVLGTELVSYNYSCTVADGCNGDSPGGVLYNPDQWANSVATGARNFIRDNINAGAEIFTKGVEVGSGSLSAKVSGRGTIILVDPGACPKESDLKKAQQYVGNLGNSLKSIADGVNSRIKQAGLTELEGQSITTPTPIPVLAMAVTPSMSLFPVDAGASGDNNGIYASLDIGISLKIGVLLNPLGIAMIAKYAKAGANAGKLISKLYATFAGMVAIGQLVAVISSARKMAVAQLDCDPPAPPEDDWEPPLDDPGGIDIPAGSGGRSDPPPPNGSPDDRRDAFQDGAPQPPSGIRGRIQTIQQHLADSNRLGLQRAATYWTLKLREQELEAFEQDTARVISATAEVDRLSAEVDQRIQGLTDGTIALQPGQMITDALQLEFDTFMTALNSIDYEQHRQSLVDAFEFAQRRYSALRGQELDLQRELKQSLRGSGIGILDSGLINWALAAVGTVGVDAVPVQIVRGLSSSGLSTSRFYSPYEAPPVLLVPSGGLNRMQGMAEARAWLETYVREGNTLIVLAQAASTDWEMLPGGDVKGLGYFEDILCKDASVRISNPSQWIAGLSHDLPNIQIDGSFTSWPKDTTIIWTRTTGNKMPAMIEYPFGNGLVVATSAYPDFYINGMQSDDDIFFARSLFGRAYLTATDGALADSVLPEAELSFTMAITNTTAVTMTGVSIERDYYDSKVEESWRWAAHQPYELRGGQQITLDRPLPSGASDKLTVRFKAPKSSGLFRIGYFINQQDSWSGSGGIAGPFYLVQSDVVPVNVSLKATRDQNDYPYGATATITATVQNRTSEPRTVVLEVESGLSAAPQTLQLEANASAQKSFTAPVYGRNDVRLVIRENNRIVTRQNVPLDLRPASLSVIVAPQRLTAGVATTARLTATTINVSPGAAVQWQVRQGNTTIAQPSSVLSGAEGYSTASTDVTLPAAAPGTSFTVRATLPNNSQSVTETLAVDLPATVQSAAIVKSLTIGTTPGAVQARLLGTAFGGSADVQVLVRQGATTLAAGEVFSQPVGSTVTTATLEVKLPDTLDIGKQYTLVISATGRAEDGSSIAYPSQLGLPLPLEAPTTALGTTQPRIREPLVVQLLPQASPILPPVDGPYTMTLRSLTTAFRSASVVAGTIGANGMIRVSTLVPVLQQGGLFEVIVESVRLRGWIARHRWSITPQEVRYTVPATAQAGTTLPWTVANAGGVDTTLRGTLQLIDRSGIAVATQTISTTLAAGAQRTIDVAVPAQLRGAAYLLAWSGVDHQRLPLNRSWELALAGLAVALNSRTERASYLATETISTTSTVMSSAPLGDGWLRLQVLSNTPRDALLTPLAGVAPGADGTGASARLSRPSAVAVSADGSFALVADSSYDIIRRVEVATGAVTTIAGRVHWPGSADGPGADARFSSPTGIAISGDNSFALVADNRNNTIRRIDLTSGAVSTVAGLAGAEGSTNDTGSAARFSSPTDVAISSDNSFALVTDHQNHMIRRIALPSGVVTTLAGAAGQSGYIDQTGTAARFTYPDGIAISGDRTFAVVADRDNNAIRKITLPDGVVTTLAGRADGWSGSKDGQGSEAEFFSPESIALTADGSIALVADYNNQTIRRVDIGTGGVDTVAGLPNTTGSADGSGASARFNEPTGVGLNATGSVALVADAGNNTIRRIELASGKVTTLAGAPRGADGSGTAAHFSGLFDIALSNAGDFAIMPDRYDNTIRRLNLQTNTVTTIAGDSSVWTGHKDGTGKGAGFAAPLGITLSPGNTFALVTEEYGNTIRRVDLQTGLVTTLAGNAEEVGGFANGTGTAARFNQPWGIAISPDASFALVADQYNQVIRKVTLPGGVVTTLAGSAGATGLVDGTGTAARFMYPKGIAISSDGSFALVADSDNRAIRRIELTNATGKVTTIAGGRYGFEDGIGTAATFALPYDVALSADDSFAIVGDPNNPGLRRIELATGKVTTILRDSGDAVHAGGVVLTPDQNSVLVSHSFEAMIMRVDLNAQSSTVVHEAWQAIGGGGTRHYDVSLGSLRDKLAARGQLVLVGTLFSAVPGGDREERHVLATSRQPFAILDTGTTLTLGTDRSLYRPNMDGYSPDDTAATVTLSGVVKNTSPQASPIVVTIRRNDGTTLPEHRIASLASGAVASFSLLDLRPPTGAVTYTASTDIGQGSERTSIRVEAADVTATTTAVPTALILGAATTLQVVLRNGGNVPAFVTADLGDGARNLQLEPGMTITATRVVTPTTAGAIELPVVFTGDLRRTDQAALAVRDESVTATATLAGPTRDANTLLRTADAGLVLALANAQGLTFDARVDYTITGPQNRTGSGGVTLAAGQGTLPVVLGKVAAGSYNATFTVRHAAGNRQIAQVTRQFTVVASRWDLTIEAGEPQIDANGARVAIRATSGATSDGAWSGTLVLAGAVQANVPVTVAPGGASSYTAAVTLRDRSGPRTIEVMLVGEDGVVVARRTITVDAAPRLAPLVTIANFVAAPATAGGMATLTLVLDNAGSAGDASLRVAAFDEVYERLAPVVANGRSTYTLEVPVPAGLIAGTYPASVRLGDEERLVDVPVTGVELAVRHSLDARSYAPGSRATWTVEVEGIRGGAAQYDVSLRYASQEVTRTITLEAGQTVGIPWTFDTGPTSDRATVLVSNHRTVEDQPRYTLVIDSGLVNVREDPQAYIETERTSYDAGEIVRLQLHLSRPVNAALLMAPAELAGIQSPIIWNSLTATADFPARGDFTVDFALPGVVPTGRYFFRWLVDGEEWTFPVDVHGITLVTEATNVEGKPAPLALRAGLAAAPAADRLAPGDTLTITTRLRVDKAVASATITAYSLAPNGAYAELGPGAELTNVPLRAGVNPVTLTGVLNTTQTGAHQIVFKVRESTSGTVLGGDVRAVDVGRATIGSLAAGQGLYTPGAQAEARLSLFGAGVVTLRAVTTRNEVLIDNRQVTLAGYSEITFPLPTSTERDEVVTVTVTGDDGVVTTRRIAYKVAKTLDATRPQVSLVSPISAATLALPAAGQIEVSGSVVEETALDLVKVNGVVATVANGRWTARVPATIGLNTIQATAVDAAGNTAVPDTIVITVEPSYGARLSITPADARAGDIVTVEAVVTSTAAMTATLIFPFDAIEPIDGTAASGRLDLAGPPVSWEGVVGPNAPVTIRWTGRVRAGVDGDLVALVQGPDMLPRRSNPVAIRFADMARLYLPMLRR